MGTEIGKCDYSNDEECIFQNKKFWVKNKKELIILFMTMLVVYTPFLTGQLNNADGFINGVIALIRKL